MNALFPPPPTAAAARLFTLRHPPREEIVVALVNNMPDAAVHATERQFSARLAEASGRLTVRLKLFAPPAIARTPALARHIADFYEDFDELEQDPPDAMIVTGTEPRATRLADEPLWPTLSRLVDLAESARIPSVWSCMAAHAAVLRLGGPHRVVLPSKLSGIFTCRARLRPEPILRGLHGRRYTVPHSRLCGLPARALRDAGFDILAEGEAPGPDIFTFEGRAPHLFLQGHPEYSPTTLLGEYRRDMARFLNRERETLPAPPAGYFGRARRAALLEFEALATRNRDPALLDRFDVLALDLATPHDWSGHAGLLYSNWLEQVAHARAPRRTGFIRLASRTGLEPVLPT